MKLRKYEHACFEVEIDEQVLVIDPGKFTTDYKPGNNVIGIIITHEHPDHFDPDTLAKIYNKNPNSILISLSDIVAKMPDYQSKSVAPGEKLNIGPFELEFSGGEHATIHTSIPSVKNLSLFIDNKLYYPGDSFTLPKQPVETLALPIAAPWLKISEVMDFVLAIKPEFTFPTHDAILSHQGKELADNRLSSTIDTFSGRYQRIDGETVEV